jgi:DNA-binding winged helix-turn-helix (wHTH) protein
MVASAAGEYNDRTMTGSLPDPAGLAGRWAERREVLLVETAARQVRRLCFGEFSAEIDESGCRVLFHGPDPVALSDLPREVLFVLLKHRPRPVTGKALLNEIWHRGANPSNVAKQVRALRLEMGDVRLGRYIRTLKKEGYAFVMPVTELGVQQPEVNFPINHTPIATVSASTAGPISTAEWQLAKEKLIKDFAGSCLHDLELLEDATKECDDRIRLIAEARGLPLEGRFPHEPISIPRVGCVAVDQRALTCGPDIDVASATAELIKYSKSTPLVVSVGSYTPACIAVLQSLRRRYGLQMNSDFAGLTGRLQILRN